MEDGGCSGNASGTGLINVKDFGASEECFYTKQYGDNQQNLAAFVYEHPVNGITYMAGRSESSRASLVALDAQGDIIWSREYTGLNYFQHIVKANDNNDLLLIRNESQEIQVVRTDESGNVLWANNYNSGNERMVKKIVPLPGLNEYIIGCWNAGFGTSDDIMLTRIDGAGNVINARRFDLSDDQPEDFILSGDTLKVVGLTVDNGFARGFTIVSTLLMVHMVVIRTMPSFLKIKEIIIGV